MITKLFKEKKDKFEKKPDHYYNFSIKKTGHCRRLLQNLIFSIKNFVIRSQKKPDALNKFKK